MKYYMKRLAIHFLGGDEVYFTAGYLLAVLRKSCGKLHYQETLKLKVFLFQIAQVLEHGQ